MGAPLTMFDLAGRGMSAQLVRMNAAASNLANAGSVAATEGEAYKPLRTHMPGHPLTDENGDVWTSPVDENAEMVEMLESARQYQNLVEAVSTAKQLMLDTMRMR